VVVLTNNKLMIHTAHKHTRIWETMGDNNGRLFWSTVNQQVNNKTLCPHTGY